MTLLHATTQNLHIFPTLLHLVSQLLSSRVVLTRGQLLFAPFRYSFVLVRLQAHFMIYLLSLLNALLQFSLRHVLSLLLRRLLCLLCLLCLHCLLRPRVHSLARSISLRSVWSHVCLGSLRSRAHATVAGTVWSHLRPRRHAICSPRHSIHSVASIHVPPVRRHGRHRTLQRRLKLLRRLLLLLLLRLLLLLLLLLLLWLLCVGSVGLGGIRCLGARSV